MSATRDSLLQYLVLVHGFALEVPFTGLSGKRRFRWDAADAERRVACEYQGIGPGHTWHREQARDHEKLNEGALCGWLVIVCSAESVNNGSCFEHVEAAMRIRDEDTAVEHGRGA